MVVSLRKWWVRTKFIAVFVILTVMLFELFRFFGGWFEPAGRYKEPTGKAVKVFRDEAGVTEPGTMLERLLFFYKYGE